MIELYIIYALLMYTQRSKCRSLPTRPAHASPELWFVHEYLRVPVHTRNQTQTDRPSNGLRHLALVAWSESSVLVVLDLAHVGHVLGHDAEVLRNHVSDCSNLLLSSLQLCTAYHIPCSDP